MRGATNGVPADEFNIRAVSEDLDKESADVEDHSESDTSDSESRSSESQEEADLTDSESEEWTDDLSNVTVYRFEEFTGAVNDMPDDAEPIDFFNLFIPDAFLSYIKNQTNLYAEQCQVKSGVDKYWKPETELGN